MAVIGTNGFEKKTIPKRRRITFGSVTILSDNPPSEAEVRKNVEEGKRAIKRLFERLQTPGIPDFVYEKDVPYFWADPHTPSRLIRHLNGKEESGFFDITKREFVVCG